MGTVHLPQTRSGTACPVELAKIVQRLIEKRIVASDGTSCPVRPAVYLDRQSNQGLGDDSSQYRSGGRNGNVDDGTGSQVD